MMSAVPSFILLWEGLECAGGLPEGQGSCVSMLVVYMLVVPLKQFQGILVTSTHNPIPTSSRVRFCITTSKSA